METNVELNNNYLEVKNEISTGINKTPMALLFYMFGRVIQKITRNPKPLPLMFCVVGLAMVILIILGLNFLVLFRGIEAATQISLAAAITVIGVMYLCVIGTYFNINKVLVSIRDSLVDFIVSPKDLSNLHQWLSFGWSPRIIRRFLFWWTAIPGVVITFLYLLLSQNGLSAFGLLIPSLMYGILGAIAWFYVPLMLLLPMRMRFYHFKLYENDPARSQVIERISNILNGYTYGYVFMSALVQLSLVTINLPIFWQVVFMIIIGWLPIIIQYSANQMAVRSIITRLKRKTLNRIQTEIQILQDGNIKDKENMETINRLMDFHERIRVTPNSTLNLQNFGNFLNQLALPLLGFLLANIDKIIDFFR